MTTTGNSIKIVMLADIHAGHIELPIDEILSDMHTVLHPHLEGADLVVIVGDMFDAMVSLGNKSTQKIIKYILDLGDLAAEMGFKIRYLMGTHSHDRQQPMLFETLLCRDGRIDCRVITDVRYEIIEDLGVSILYIPDDLPFDDPMEHVKDYCKRTACEPADILLFHGMMGDILPKGIPAPKNAYYSRDLDLLCKGFVGAGHDHLAKSIIYKKEEHKRPNKYVCGSLLRNKHNEEGDKGFWVLNYNKDTCCETAEFVVNPNARLFKTMSLLHIEAVDGSYPPHVCDAMFSDIQDFCQAVRAQNTSGRPIRLRFELEDNNLRSAITQMIPVYFEGCSTPIRTTFKRPKNSSSKVSQQAKSEIKLAFEEISENNILKIAQDDMATRGIDIDLGWIKTAIMEEVA